MMSLSCRMETVVELHTAILSLSVLNCSSPRRRGLRGGLASAPVDTDAVIAAMEDQRLAGHRAPRRIGHLRRRGRRSGQDVLTLSAGVDQLLAGAATPRSE